jgi:hypothetical protein
VRRHLGVLVRDERDGAAPAFRGEVGQIEWIPDAVENVLAWVELRHDAA